MTWWWGWKTGGKKTGNVRGGLGESRRQSRGDDRYQRQEKKSSLYYNHHPPQVGETKILELEEELRVVANNLKSLEVMGMMMMIAMVMKRSWEL